MTTLHTKSPCCQGTIYQHGQRRRKCSVCGKTWRIRPAKRGRKCLRFSSHFFLKYLTNQTGPIVHQASKHRLKSPTFNKRIRKTLKKFIDQTPFATVPEGQLIVIADALIQTINEKVWTVYLLLFRSVELDKAVIFPPYIREGQEHYHGGWQEVFQRVPNDVRGRILALICDGAPELVGQAKRNGWIIQRCHFHIRHRLANYIRTGPKAHNREMGLRIKKLVDTVLLDANTEQAQHAVSILKHEIFSTLRSRYLRTYLRGFLKNYQDFRSYLLHSELNLPTTSNAAESLFSLVRDLQKRARGFRTPESFKDWVIAIFKYRKTIKCNGKFHRIK